MKRDIYLKLLDWKKAGMRKPLILKGVRQVGKTYILKEFGKNEYGNVADTGLLGAMSNLSARTIVEGNKLFTGFNGAFTENYVAQELIAALSSQGYPLRELYYWSYNHSGEVDFIVQYEEDILPLEVKAGTSRKKTSLVIYGEKYKPAVLSRATQMNFKQDGYTRNYPLYAVSHFPGRL